MIFDIPLIYNISSKMRNHVDIIHPYNFPSISKIFFSRWNLYLIACVIALHFLSFYYFSFRWNVEKIEYSQWLQPEIFRIFTIDNGISFQSWFILCIELQLYTVSTFPFVIIISFHATRIFFVDRTNALRYFQKDWIVLRPCLAIAVIKSKRVYVSCCLKKIATCNDLYG